MQQIPAPDDYMPPHDALFVVVTGQNLKTLKSSLKF